MMIKMSCMKIIVSNVARVQACNSLEGVDTHTCLLHIVTWAHILYSTKLALTGLNGVD